MDQIINYLLFAHFMVLFICSVLQLITRNRSIVNIFMAFLFLCLGYLLFYFWLYRIHIINLIPRLLYSDLAVTFLLGPIAYSYIKSITGEKIKFTFGYFLQYIPAISVLIFFILYKHSKYVIPVNRSNIYPDYNRDLPIYMISILADTWVCVYILITVIKIRIFIKSEKTIITKEIRAVFFFFVAIIANSSLLLVGHYLKNNPLIAFVTIINGGLGVFYFLYIYRHTEQNHNIIKIPKHVRNLELLPNRINLEILLKKLEQLIDIEAVYRDPEISLQSLSNRLGIDSHHLSNILNSKMGMNFRTFINHYRLKEAMRLLVEEPKKSVIEIAFEVGFNSKTAFNTLFMKMTGLTPTEYQKKQEKRVPIS